MDLPWHVATEENGGCCCPRVGGGLRIPSTLRRRAVRLQLDAHGSQQGGHCRPPSISTRHSERCCPWPSSLSAPHSRGDLQATPRLPARPLLLLLCTVSLGTFLHSSPLVTVSCRCWLVIALARSAKLRSKPTELTTDQAPWMPAGAQDGELQTTQLCSSPKLILTWFPQVTNEKPGRSPRPKGHLVVSLLTLSSQQDRTSPRLMPCSKRAALHTVHRHPSELPGLARPQPSFFQTLLPGFPLGTCPLGPVTPWRRWGTACHLLRRCPRALARAALQIHSCASSLSTWETPAPSPRGFEVWVCMPGCRPGCLCGDRPHGAAS